jgi:speckle-type POZ protein
LEAVVCQTFVSVKHVDTYGALVHIKNEDSRAVFACEIAHDNQDTLSIEVEADIFYLSGVTNYFDAPSTSVQKGLHSLYKSEEVTDTIIKCDAKEFKVHRAVLASLSPVFRAMFVADMMERQTGVIVVTDITSAAMSDLITYLYTGTAPNLNALAGDLLGVAERYQLPHLLAMCENELGRKLQANGVIETLILACLHDRVCLKKACLEYICRNSAAVFRTSEWLDFKDHKDQYASLYVEILEEVLHV